ncbi:MAG TPA: hypothetical protein VFN11_19905, partial [Ktedonobacterales bacterium]|nr:hypothetical protein [Ktedonobacterales bacterium]
VGAVAIAFGLTFGLGGQETARRLVARSENTVTDAAARIQAQQGTDFYSTPTAANPQRSAANAANPEVPTEQLVGQLAMA